MKLSLVTTLSLVILLPYIFGDEDCLCTFPDHLIGMITLDNGEKRTFHKNNVADVFLWFESSIEIIDLRRMKQYIIRGTILSTCRSFDIKSLDWHPYVPPRCVPKNATALPCPTAPPQKLWYIYYCEDINSTGTTLADYADENSTCHNNTVPNRNVECYQASETNFQRHYLITRTGQNTCLPIDMHIRFTGNGHNITFHETSRELHIPDLEEVENVRSWILNSTDFGSKCAGLQDIIRGDF